MKQVAQRYDEAVPVDKLRPHPLNANEGARDIIAESIEENGWYGAVVAHEGTGYIVAGNHRWEEACKAGADTIPVIWLDVDDKRATKILAVDNESNRKGQNDQVRLAALLKSLEGDYAGTAYVSDDLDELLRVTGQLAEDNAAFLGGFGEAGRGQEPTLGVGDWVSLSFTMRSEDRDAVLAWLRKEQADAGVETAAETLVHLAHT